MRQRAHSSAIMLATLLAWLLVTPDRASAEGFTVIVPVNITGLHPDVSKIRLNVFLRVPSATTTSGVQNVGFGHNILGTDVVDQSVQEDVEILIDPQPGQNIFSAETYRISMNLAVSGAGYCTTNFVYAADHACGGKNMMQTYADLEGPISDLIPE